MSLSDAKKLGDLKEKAKELLNAYYANFGAQRPQALISALKEMTEYLQEQGFNVQVTTTPSRGFVATYKDINITAEASKDDDSFFGADYLINIALGKPKTQVSLNVKRGKRVNSPLGHGSLSQQIDDYEKRYIPEIESLDPSELDGSYKLSVIEEHRNSKTKIEFENGKSVIDYLFKK